MVAEMEAESQEKTHKLSEMLNAKELEAASVDGSVDSLQVRFLVFIFPSTKHFLVFTLKPFQFVDAFGDLLLLK